MFRPALLPVMALSLAFAAHTARGQTEDINNPAELREIIQELRVENAQLKLQIESLRRQVAELQKQLEGAREGENPAAGNAQQEMIVRIRAIRDISDPGERLKRIAELKRQLPGAQKQLQDAKRRFQDMEEDNARDRSAWENGRRPYSRPRQGLRWTAPHSNQSLSIARMDIADAQKRFNRLDREIKQLERKQEIQVLVVGELETDEGDSANVADVATASEMTSAGHQVEVRIIVEDSLARWIQQRKPGDRICVRGHIIDAEEDYIDVEAVRLSDPK